MARRKNNKLSCCDLARIDAWRIVGLNAKEIRELEWVQVKGWKRTTIEAAYKRLEVSLTIQGLILSN